MTQALINALHNPQAYSHNVDDIKVIETQISWVILTGEYAYKIKKAVDFGFLNFTALATRHHFCNEELRLNQRLTQDIYLGVVPITGTTAQPQMDGKAGEAIEYAVKMRQFPQSQLLGNLQRSGELNEQYIDTLTHKIAKFHISAPSVPADHPLGDPQAIMAPIRQNFEQIREMLTESRDLVQLDALEAWAESSFERLIPLLEARRHQGLIKECHGDIHLGNVTLLDGEVTLFDCIEFYEPFRLIDVACDAAFLAMDLDDRGLKAMSRRFINSWLEETGDFAAIPLINFYKAFRAMVRGKVNLFRLAQEDDAVQKAAIVQIYRKYADLAESYSAIPCRFLAITHGISAVGKSHLAMRLVEALGALRFRSYAERQRLFGEQPKEAANLMRTGIYTPQASDTTYQRLHDLAKQALHAGYSVVIDATYLEQARRLAALNIAENEGVPFFILDCQAPDEVIAAWLAQRPHEIIDPSEATNEIIQIQQVNREPLNAEEKAHRYLVETNESVTTDKLIEHLRQRIPGL